MQLVVFEDADCGDLLPLVYWRTAAELRCGVDRLLDKIETACGVRAVLWARPELAEVARERLERAVNTPLPQGEAVWLVNSRLLLRSRPDLSVGAAAWRGETLLAAHVPEELTAGLTPDLCCDAAALRKHLSALKPAGLAEGSYDLIDYPWQLVHRNAGEIVRQLAIVPLAHAGVGTRRLGSAQVGAHLLNETAIYVAPGARIKPGAALDAEGGPIFVDEGATISPNATIQGPCYIGPHTLVQPGAVIREGCTFGPWCKVGGEIEATIFQGYSNKQHHGFLGHSFVCEWVNLGAGTVNSDLKNTYGSVRVTLPYRSLDTGEMFVGSFIADHAKTGINVALPTGAVIGFAANVLVSRLALKFVPSFAWLTDDGMERYDPPRALAVARKVMARRNVAMSAAEEELFLRVADLALRVEP